MLFFQLARAAVAGDVRYACQVRRLVSGLLGAACWMAGAGPALAAGVPVDQPQPKEDVTLAMFVLIVALIAVLTLAVALENRRGSGH